MAQGLKASLWYRSLVLMQGRCRVGMPSTTKPQGSLSSLWPVYRATSTQDSPKRGLHALTLHCDVHFVDRWGAEWRAQSHPCHSLSAFTKDLSHKDPEIGPLMNLQCPGLSSFKRAHTATDLQASLQEESQRDRERHRERERERERRE